MDLVKKVIVGLVGLIVIFQLLAAFAPDLGAAANNITSQSETLPLTSLFAKGGVIFLIVMVGVTLTVIYKFMPKK